MLAVLIYIVDAARRALRKVVHSVSIIIDSYREAQEFRRKTPRLYIED